MSHEPRIPEPSPAQGSQPSKYWEKAFDGLDAEVKKRVTKLKKTFDDDTEKALQRLAGRKSSTETVKKLQELEHIYQHLSTRRKGDIQRLSMISKKRLDDNTVVRISDILNEARQSSVDASGSNESEKLDELLELCQERQRLSKVKKHEIEFLGKSYFVHDLWTKVTNKLDALKAPIDVATQANPTAGLVWSVIKVFLQFAILVEDVAGSILTGIEKALGAIQRGSIYERHIRAIQQDPTDISHSHILTFESTLISVYIRIFKFFSQAAAALEKNKVSYWRVFWDQDDIVEFEEDILKDEQMLHHNSSLSTMITQNAMLMTVTRIVSDLRDQLRNNEKLKQQRDLKRSRETTLGWLSCLPVKDYHIEAHERWTKNTGGWIFKRDEYARLIEEDGPRLLWIRGIPGAGKTVLISHIIDHYLQRASKDANIARQNDNDINPRNAEEENDAGEDVHLAYFYCKRDVAERRNSESIFRSFIKQLAVKYHPLPESIHRIYEEKHSPNSFSNKVYPEQYRRILEELIPRTTDTILILDALDECTWDAGQAADDEGNKKDMNDVLRTFGYLLKSGLPVKIIVASRYDEAIEASLSDKYYIEISRKDSWDDIRAMIKSRIKQHRTLKKEPSITKELRKRIMNVFKSKSQGMFQWASLHIGYLLTLPSPSAIEEELGHLPLGLQRAYDEFFKRIRLQTDFKTHMALRVFRWLLACQGSLDKKILLPAISQTLKQSKANDVYGDVSAILAVCQNLVVTEGDLLRFSHLSVQEYCESHQTDLMEDCHLEVVKVCIWILFYHESRDLTNTYWVFRHFDPIKFDLVRPLDLQLPLLDGISKLFSLWKFAYRVWHYHFEKINSNEQKDKVLQLVKDWTKEDSFHVGFRNWILLTVTDLVSMQFPLQAKMSHAENLGLWMRSTDIMRVTRRDLTVALIIEESVLAGICWNMKDSFESNFLSNYRYIEQSEGEVATHRTELEESSEQERGEENTPKSNVISLKSEIQELKTILTNFDALYRHHLSLATLDWLAIFRSLLCKSERSTHRCYEELASLILLLFSVQRAGVKSNEAEFATWLFQEFPKLSRPHKISYRCLIPPIACLDLSASLCRAARDLDKSFIQVILNHGAEVNDRLWEFEGTPLIIAIRHRRFENTKLLLENFADVNTETLIEACVRDDMRILHLLLEYPKTEINMVSSTARYGTVLVAACANNRSRAVKALLNKGAYVNTETKSGNYRTAISAAIDLACLRIIRLLVRNGVRGPPHAIGISQRLDGARKYARRLGDIQQLSWILVEQLELDSLRECSYDEIGRLGQDDNGGDESEVVCISEDDSDDSDEADSDGDDYDDNDDQHEKCGADEAIQVDISGLNRVSDIRVQDPSNQADAVQHSHANDITTNMADILRQLTIKTKFSSMGTAKIIAETIGFNDHRNEESLWKGIENLLTVTDKKDWEEARKSWFSFIDLAEDCDCEDKGPGDADVERLANGGSATRDLEESDFDYEPYETELDLDWNTSEGEWDENSEEAD